MVIVARCDIPTVVVVVLLQIQVFLVVLMGEHLPVFRMVIWSKQWTARPWRWGNCVTTEQTCIFMIIVLFSLNYCCTDSLRCQRITTSRTRSGILMLCSNPNNILLVMHMTRFSFQVSFCLVYSFCNWSHVSQAQRPLGRPRHRWEDNIKVDLQEVGCGGIDWIELAQVWDR